MSIKVKNSELGKAVNQAELEQAFDKDIPQLIKEVQAARRSSVQMKISIKQNI